MRTPLKRASKRAPTWYSQSLASKSLWSYGPIPINRGQGHKDLEAKGQLYHVGTRFEALFTGVLMEASDSSCNFLCMLTLGLEQCVRASPTRRGNSKIMLRHLNTESQLRLLNLGIELRSLIKMEHIHRHKKKLPENIPGHIEVSKAYYLF